MKTPTLALADLLKELSAPTNEPSGMSVAEIVESLGLSDTEYSHCKVREMLKRAIASGKAEPVKMKRPTIMGTIRPVVVFRAVSCTGKSRVTGKRTVTSPVVSRKSR